MYVYFLFFVIKYCNIIHFYKTEYLGQIKGKYIYVQFFIVYTIKNRKYHHHIIFQINYCDFIYNIYVIFFIFLYTLYTYILIITCLYTNVCTVYCI